MKNRNSSIELLRIISMIMIVVSHYTVHNGVDNFSLPFGFNRILLEITDLGGIGVILFVLITGFFCIDSTKPFKLKKLLMLWGEVFFYSLIIYFIFVLFDLKSFSFKEILKYSLPITFKNYWFMSSYLLLYIFIPYINRFLNSIRKREYLMFIIICFFVFSVFPTITTKNFFSNEFIQFILYYSVGGYMKKYNFKCLKNEKVNIHIVAILFFLVLISIISIDLLGNKISFSGINSAYFLYRRSFICLLISVVILNIFTNMDYFTSKFINYLSSCMLGVYLISDNPLIRSVLWTDIFNVHRYVSSSFLILHMIACVLLVFITCIVFEIIRKNTFEKVYNKLCDIVILWMEKRNFYNCILNFLKKME